MAVHLVQHAPNKTIALEHMPKRLALTGVDVPLLSNILEAGQQFGFACVAIHLDQGRIGAQQPPIGTNAIGANGQEVEK
ncbi:MAG: hypothetical protein R3E56_04365 [Burkholderiaceae bacterium]